MSTQCDAFPKSQLPAFHPARIRAPNPVKPVLVAISLAIIVGCQPSHNKSVTSKIASGSPETRTLTNPATVLRPLGGWSGRIVSINQKLRFAVVDFSLNQIPQTGRVLSVYRGGTKVGEVRLGAQTRGDFATAELLEGEFLRGDEVRTE